MELNIVRSVISVIPGSNANPRRVGYSELGRGWSKSRVLRGSFICIDKSGKFWQSGFSNHSGIMTRRSRRHMRYSPRCHGITSLSEGAMPEDGQYMRMCISLAKKALGCTSPNPMVGCVIVKDGHIVGQGFHPKAGEPHAEVFALREAGTKAEGATAYVSLEPCNHYGRTPPCTQALIQARVGRVVVGMVDPNPIVASKGVATLRNSGIDVTVGVEEKLCQTMNEAYIHRILTGKPFITMRFSMSLDGGMLDDLGDGAAEEGGYYSKMLQQYDGVIVSDQTLYDNLNLLSSEAGAKQPLRIVVTRTLVLPIDSLIFNTDLAPTLVLADEKAIVDNLQSAGKLNGQTMDMLLRQRGVEVVILKKLEIDSVLDICSQRGLCSVFIDSRGLASAGLENFIGKQALEEEAVQKLVIAICPMISGNKRTELNFDIPPAKLNRLRTKLSKDVAVVEGYFPRDFN